MGGLSITQIQDREVNQSVFIPETDLIVYGCSDGILAV